MTNEDEEDASGGDDDNNNNTDDEPPQRLFCQGMYMIMSMSGFQSTLFGTHPADCLAYLSTHWTLDSMGKFQGAMSK
jgi:hypothetical protein